MYVLFSLKEQLDASRAELEKLESNKISESDDTHAVVQRMLRMAKEFNEVAEARDNAIAAMADMEAAHRESLKKLHARMDDIKDKAREDAHEASRKLHELEEAKLEVKSMRRDWEQVGFHHGLNPCGADANVWCRCRFNWRHRTMNLRRTGCHQR